MSLPAVSKHLRVLEDAGLLRRRVEGRTHFLAVNAKPLAQATDWLERQRRFWEGSFDRLAQLLEEPDHTVTTASLQTEALITHHSIVPISNHSNPSLPCPPSKIPTPSM